LRRFIEARVQLTFDEQKAVMAEMFGRIEELFALKTTLEQQLLDAEAGGCFLRSSARRFKWGWRVAWSGHDR